MPTRPTGENAATRPARPPRRPPAARRLPAPRGAAPAPGAATPSQEVPPRLLVTIALLCAIGPFGIDTYLPTFPDLARDLSTSAARVQLTLTTFMLGMAVGQLVLGPLSDRLGRRRLLLAGTAVTFLAGVVCALSPSIGVLVAARLVQGLAGAAGMVIGRAVIADLATGRTAARAFSTLGVIGGVAPVLAPVLGGLIAGHGGWRGIFGVTALLAAAMLVAAWFVLPETLPRERRHAGGLREVASTARAVLSRRRYVGYVGCLVLVFATVFAYVSASPFVLQNVVGLSPRTYSVVFATNALGIVAAGAVSNRLLRRRTPAQVLTAGVALQVVCAAGLFTTVVALDAWAPAVLVLLWFTMFSIGLVFGNATALAADEVRFASGTGSALQGALQFTVGALVSSLVGLAGEHSAVPMVAVMLGCSGAAALVLVLVARPRRTHP
ncbi:DHA1 family bicyclomycin/chloramphenicol resistance-like MFS transporter [Kineococcus radiotolerans]|uniref:DHA1 family bicyclomycin/chloramphenicol resistance-like MFS transporter n=1 Tax=Kineococcus radiotolerans TaxID=131568 RepID=A0A7W4TJV1_KINRA|nr:multidrug effflux MFS transporter [Kineococcus radiotolerans]MBB2899923.1 DHA1 family bicyclomycin/chloramphenicol resistance-like MFS transporter [Kineococcus radiotolerans]